MLGSYGPALTLLRATDSESQGREGQQEVWWILFHRLLLTLGSRPQSERPADVCLGLSQPQQFDGDES